MELLNTVVNLWKRSGVWRALVWVASLTTFFAIATVFQGGSTKQTQQQKHSASQCDALLQKQSVTAYSQGGTPATNVTQTRNGNVLAQAHARVAAFETRIVSISEPSMGERCVAMRDALKNLRADDHDYIRCLPDTDKNEMLDKATRCTRDLEDSDKHFDQLFSAHSTYLKYPSTESLVRFATVAKGMTAFDKSRQRWVSLDSKLLRDVSNSVANLENSDNRIAELAAAATSGGQVSSPEKAKAFAVAAEQITEFDQSRMTETQKGFLQRGLELSLKLKEVGTLLSELREALQFVSTIYRDDSQRRLMDVLLKVNQLPPELISVVERQEIAGAQKQASELAIDRLVRITRGIDVSTATVATCLELKNAYDLIKQVASSKELDHEQEQALRVAFMAATLLEESDLRLSRLVSTAAAWNETPNIDMGARIRSILQSVTDFDRERLLVDHRQALDTLRSAAAMIDATESRTIGAENRSDISVQIVAENDYPATSVAVDLLAKKIKAMGFEVDTRRSVYAISIAVGVEKIKHKAAGAETPVYSTLANVKITGVWQLTGKPLIQSSAKGIVEKSVASESERVNNTISAAVEKLTEEFKDSITQRH